MLLGSLPFANSHLDRNALVRTDPDAMTVARNDPATRVLLVSESGVAVRGDYSDGGSESQSGSEPGSGERRLHLDLCEPAHVRNASVWVYLGRADGRDYLAGLVPTESGELDDAGYMWRTPRDIATGLDDFEAALAVEATGMMTWHRNHPHCSRCGELLDVVDSGWVRKCPQDGSQHFPRTDPAVIMSVVDRFERILLASNTLYDDTRRCSVLAGFVEPGESLEAAVAREVMEETGVRVDSVEYVASQPWPFPTSLMFGFRARTEIDGPSQEFVLQAEELSSAAWFTRDELAEQARDGTIWLPPRVSISRALIEGWFGGPLEVKSDAMRRPITRNR